MSSVAFVELWSGGQHSQSDTTAGPWLPAHCLDCTGRDSGPVTRGLRADAAPGARRCAHDRCDLSCRAVGVDCRVGDRDRTPLAVGLLADHGCLSVRSLAPSGICASARRSHAGNWSKLVRSSAGHHRSRAVSNRAGDVLGLSEGRRLGSLLTRSAGIWYEASHRAAP